MDIKELLDSKTYVREGSPALSVREYLDPVLNKMVNLVSESDIKVEVDNTVENQNDDGTINVSFGRVKIEAQLPALVDNVAGSTVGLVYALDKQTPTFVAYSGTRVFACTNLCVWSDEMVDKVADNHKKAQKSALDYINGYEQSVEDFRTFYKTMSDRGLDKEEYERLIGYMLINSGAGYGSTIVTKAVKLFGNNKSVYHIRENESPSMWKVYNGFTQGLTDSGNILDSPQQTLKLTKTLVSFN